MKKIIMMIYIFILIISIYGCGNDTSFNNVSNDKIKQKETIEKVINNYDWSSFENKPFINKHPRGPSCKVTLYDVNQDGLEDIILSNYNTQRDIVLNEVINIVNGKVVSIGGFWGELDGVKCDDEMNIPMYKKLLCCLLFVVILSGCTESDLQESVSKTNSEANSSNKMSSVEKQKDDISSDNKILYSMIGKTATELSTSDFEILLNTPIFTLYEVLDFPVPTEKNEWMMGRTTSTDKLPGVVLNGGYSNDLKSELPTSFYIFKSEDLIGNDNIPIGYSFEQIKKTKKWSGFEMKTINYLMGYSGEEATPLETLSCKDKSIVYDFTISGEWAYYPKEKHILTADTICIYREKDS